MAKKRVIVVTDGDGRAKAAARQAARNLGLHYIERSAGTPTLASGAALAAMAKQAPVEPVIVMFDDHGKKGKGLGERALEEFAADPEIEIVGAVAVASNTKSDRPVTVDESVTKEGEVTGGPVGKSGSPEPPGHKRLEGDTVGILSRLEIPKIVGVGDLGKMDSQDAVEKGALITTRAIREILDEQQM
ncbi:MAG: stage V sporulation protein AE [Firmicutes bacterium]|nr:stage V sporulation protein AE [Bacillota bacterium]